jgi:mannitol 2-dehydrogenase
MGGVKDATFAPMTHDMAITAASKGENWSKFFLHPNSDFHASLTGGLDSHPLNSANLPAIARSQRGNVKSKCMPPPAYARSLESFESIICHIGVGGFHRSHMAMYTHERLLSQMASDYQGNTERWGIVGIGIMPWDSTMGNVLKKQDHMYCVLGRDPEETTCTIVGSILGFVGPDKETENNVLERLANAQTKIVSLTITEKGYCLDLKNELDLMNPLVKHDLEKPDEVCQSAVGTIVKALNLRFERGMSPFTVMSCDNLPGNGHLTEAIVHRFLEARGDDELTNWVKAKCAFPNTMVDRITPATRPLDPEKPHEYSDTIRGLVRDVAGVEDDWPVIAEGYMQWVIEDKFVCGRPRWEEEGALFAENVGPYEAMKLRLLNAGHSAISYTSYLMAQRHVDVAMNAQSLEPLNNPIPDFCVQFFKDQAPNVPPVPGVDLDEYQLTLLKRFGNPFIKDTLQRLAEDGSAKLVLTMREAAINNANNGRSVKSFSLVVAAWIRYLVGVDEKGEVITITDPRSEELSLLAREVLNCPEGTLPVTAPSTPPTKFLKAVFGEELASNSVISDAVFTSLTEVVQTSTHATLSKFSESN